MKLVYLFIYIVIESEAFEVLHRLNDISEKWYLLCDIFLMGNLSVLKSHDSIAIVVSFFCDIFSLYFAHGWVLPWWHLFVSHSDKYMVISFYGQSHSMTFYWRKLFAWFAFTFECSCIKWDLPLDIVYSCC